MQKTSGIVGLDLNWPTILTGISYRGMYVPFVCIEAGAAAYMRSWRKTGTNALLVIVAKVVFRDLQACSTCGCDGCCTDVSHSDAAEAKVSTVHPTPVAVLRVFE